MSHRRTSLKTEDRKHFQEKNDHNNDKQRYEESDSNDIADDKFVKF